MPITAHVLAASVSPRGNFIFTAQSRFPKFILAQYNTHGAIRKSAGSSRAKPISTLIGEIEEECYIPTEFTKNKKGMQSSEAIDEKANSKALMHWHTAKRNAIIAAKRLQDCGVHKQQANRLIEPFCYVDHVSTATDWANFFSLRLGHEAQPEMQELANCLFEAITKAKENARQVNYTGWHLPYISPFAYGEAQNFDELWELHNFILNNMAYVKERYPKDRFMLKQLEFKKLRIRESDLMIAIEELQITRDISAARCARVSYKPFDYNSAVDNYERVVVKDLALADSLKSSKPIHASPFEHQATPKLMNRYHKAFWGWRAARQSLVNETVYDYQGLR